MLASQVKTNHLWWSLWTGTEKTAFSRSIAAYHVPQNLLICSSEYLAYQLQLGSLHDWLFIVNYHSPSSTCLLHQSDRIIKG